MAIIFLEKKQRQRYLVIALVGIIVLVPVLVWRVFLKPPEAGPPPIIAQPPKIEIDYEILKNPDLQELQTLEAIEPFENGIGRENPFTLPNQP